MSATPGSLPLPRCAARACAALAVLACALPARAQVPTIDVAAIAKAVEIIDHAQTQINRLNTIRDHLDDQVVAATRPWQDLAAEAEALRTSAINLPGAVTRPPPLIGGMLQQRAQGTAPVEPGDSTNAELLDPPDDTAAQVRAAVTPTAAGDPLAGDRAARIATAVAHHDRRRRLLAADRDRREMRNAADVRLAGRSMSVAAAAERSLTAGQASWEERSWSALWERSAATAHTHAVMTAQLLNHASADHERRTLERQESLAAGARARIAALQAVARSKANHAAYQASTTRDGGDDLWESCGGRFFSGGCETVPAGF